MSEFTEQDVPRAPAIAMPVFAPLFVPGTESVTVRWLTVEIPVTAVVTERVLPEGLTVPDEPTLGLWVAEFIGAEFRSNDKVEQRPAYMQGGASLRCSRPDGPDGAYALETFVEGLNHGILGRELFGLPKKQARHVHLSETPEGFDFDIISATGASIVAGSAQLNPVPEGLVPCPAWFNRHFTVKAIPSAEGNGYDFCKLVEIPWHMSLAADARSGTAQLVWGDSHSDPLSLFEPTGTILSRAGTATLDIAYGHYLGDVVPPEPVGQHFWN